MRILGIETSCDETAAAIVEDGHILRANVIKSQIDIHKAYGGVVPEVAARSHLEVILPVIDEAFSRANCTWKDIDGIAVTYAPGLIGSLLIGTLTARTLAVLKNKPLYAVHHVEGHVYANFLTKGTSSSPLLSSQPQFPLLALIVSGGHSQLALFQDHGKFELLGQTQDDAVGEAFDKVAKILGLPYPGGPSVAEAALNGDPNRYNFPKAQLKCTHSGPHRGINSNTEEVVQPTDDGVCHYYDFSFSGLKTAVLRRVQQECGKTHTFPSYELAALLTPSQRNDFAASFQHTAIATLVSNTLKAYRDYQPRSVVIAGGVAANQELRRQLSAALPLPIEYAPMDLCTDNAAMIATLGCFTALYGSPSDPYTLDVVPSLSMTKTTWR